MSRGLGKLQRKLLELLNAHVPTIRRVGMSTHELAAHVFLGGSLWPHRHRDLTRAQINAVRRALNGLVDVGLVVRLGAIDDFTRTHFWIRSHGIGATAASICDHRASCKRGTISTDSVEPFAFRGPFLTASTIIALGGIFTRAHFWIESRGIGAYGEAASVPE